MLQAGSPQYCVHVMYASAAFRHPSFFLQPEGGASSPVEDLPPIQFKRVVTHSYTSGIHVLARLPVPHPLLRAPCRRLAPEPKPPDPSSSCDDAEEVPLYYETEHADDVLAQYRGCVFDCSGFLASRVSCERAYLASDGQVRPLKIFVVKGAHVFAVCKTPLETRSYCLVVILDLHIWCQVRHFGTIFPNKQQCAHFLAMLSTCCHGDIFHTPSMGPRSRSAAIQNK